MRKAMWVGFLATVLAGCHGEAPRAKSSETEEPADLTSAELDELERLQKELAAASKPLHDEFFSLISASHRWALCGVGNANTPELLATLLDRVQASPELAALTRRLHDLSMRNEARSFRIYRSMGGMAAMRWADCQGYQLEATRQWLASADPKLATAALKHPETAKPENTITDAEMRAWRDLAFDTSEQNPFSNRALDQLVEAIGTMSFCDGLSDYRDALARYMNYERIVDIDRDRMQTYVELRVREQRYTHRVWRELGIDGLMREDRCGPGVLDAARARLESY